MIKFVEGSTVKTRFAYDWDSILEAVVVKVTKNSIVLDIGQFGTKRVKIHTDSDGVEFCYPLGRYSMAPMFKAGRVK